eukprot:m51a1_g4212 putative calcium-binding protein 39 (330) ;mRNA; f:68049-69579
MFWSGKKQKTPQELAKGIHDALTDRTSGAQKKIAEEASRNLSVVKSILFGDAEHEPSAEAAAAIANEFYSNDILLLLVQNLSKFDFEAKKDVAYCFTSLLRRSIGNRLPTVEYVERNATILELLVHGYEDAEIAISAGSMLRECAQHEPLARIVLNGEYVWNFFQYVQDIKFDIACDAFSTFKELLTQHKETAAMFLEKNYDRFFEYYNQLLTSSNYVTKRQSLKLLGELLLDRSNFNIMTKYISSSTKMKMMMELLRDKSRSIQYEAFHVFKVFVANPNKPSVILDILIQNKDALIRFLENFQNERTDEEQFTEEKAFLIKQISALHK